jgi:3-methylfumaryl-CoA hydratase
MPEVALVKPATPASSSPPDLQAWIGRKESTCDTVTPQLAQRLSATIESSRASFAVGDELPRGWYSVLFPRVVPRSQIGGDGHPALGDFLPPVALPKRMFAGKRITFSAPITIGDSLERVSEIISVQSKQGSSGALVFVTVRHTINNATGVAVVEEQDVVYREATTGAPAAGGKGQTPPPVFNARHTSAPIVADPVMIFRYSALCFNGHRIHYDYPYVTQVEGYPALVVNGGLSTICAIEHLHDAWGGALLSLSTRNTSPLFAGEPFHIESAPSQQADGVDFRVVKEGGKAVVVGHAVLRGAR